MQKKEERMDIAEVLARRRPQRIAKRAMDIAVSYTHLCPRFVQMNPQRAAAAGKRRRSERAENQSENKTKKPCKVNLAGLIWWSVLDSNQ